MLKTKSFLAVDFGAGSLKLAEFEVNEAGGLRLKQYALKSLGAEGAQESAREALIQKAVQELLTEKARDNQGHRLIIADEMAERLAEEMQSRGKKALQASIVGSLLSLNETNFVKVKYMSLCQDDFALKSTEVVSSACTL